MVTMRVLRARRKVLLPSRREPVYGTSPSGAQTWDARPPGGGRPFLLT